MTPLENMKNITYIRNLIAMYVSRDEVQAVREKQKPSMALRVSLSDCCDLSRLRSVSAMVHVREPGVLMRGLYD